jgi:hypothetical protein
LARAGQKNNFGKASVQRAKKTLESVLKTRFRMLLVMLMEMASHEHGVTRQLDAVCSRRAGLWVAAAASAGAKEHG